MGMSSPFGGADTIEHGPNEQPRSHECENRRLDAASEGAVGIITGISWISVQLLDFSTEKKRLRWRRFPNHEPILICPHLTA